MLQIIKETVFAALNQGYQKEPLEKEDKFHKKCVKRRTKEDFFESF